MKPNKHIGILLAFLILFCNTGMALNVHYCHGEVSSVSFSYKLQDPCNTIHEKQEEKTCCAAAGESHKKCCDNDIVKLQDNTDNIIVKSLQLDLSAFCAATEWNPVAFYTEHAIVKKDFPSFYCESNAPPLFKLYCKYIFYA
ncbi:hypothetical protein [Flavobacterium sp. MK4S-17]|uniref:HYC_CC_PP family protein n=1 Tax=Flavobacterium sp. MK4S-17 TaxID=2543737 RepID=UPI00135A5308|nr:hypothetical protein [Flavobacterium sp. MK4S-17]